MLYALDLNPQDFEEVARTFWLENSCDQEVRGFAEALVIGTIVKKNEIDRIIGSLIQNWEINRLSTVDRNIIRLGAFEMLFLHDNTGSSIPCAVTINEAVEIAKKFGTRDSGGFVNGILDQIRKTQQNRAPN